jgi:hypothetical protein
MEYSKLPKRVFNSPLIEYANFADGVHVNLIRLIKPYANGAAYAVYVSSKDPRHQSGLFKTIDKAKANFERTVTARTGETELLKKGITNN